MLFSSVNFVFLIISFQKYIIKLIKIMKVIYFSMMLLCFIIVADSVITTCHYTCQTCSGLQYYQCLTCPENRGDAETGQPISGMCYCNNETDETQEGACTQSNQFNYNNKSAIAALIGLCLFFSTCTMLITGMRHFFIKTIEDIQEISIIVFINLYFPQQFDIFLTHLYRFNISSYTFQSIANGSLFYVNDRLDLITSTDGQNIFGKYKLLYKTANFFANQFTWILVASCFIVVGIIVKFIRQCLKKRQDQLRAERQQKGNKVMEESLPNYQHDNKIGNQSNTIEEFQNNQSEVSDTKYKITTSRSHLEPPKFQSLSYYIFNKLYNIIWLNFFITFFFLSLIEINLNIFTQISNLTFSSGFAATGAYFSALFMAFEFVILFLLVLKVRQECIKPQWMRDYAYTAPIYMIRTNYKTVGRYFWFFSCIKKILIALLITVFYQQPTSAILSVSVVQTIFLAFSVYAEPHERRYIRIHYYFMEGFKIFLYISLINFTEKYIEYIRMIQLTKIMYFMLVFIFTFNLVYILANIIAERQIYIRALSKKFCPDNPQNKYLKGRIGYHSQGRLYIYETQ